MEDPEPSIVLAGLALCLLSLAFTSAVDAAFTAISRHRLNAMVADGGARARAMTWLMDDPYRFKSTVLILNIVATIVATALTLWTVAPLLLWQRGLALVGLLLAMLIVGEVVPKALAVRSPDTVALFLAGPLSLVAWLLWPLVALLNAVTAPLFGAISGNRPFTSPLVTEEELRMMVNVGEEEGLIEHEERAMIEGIFSFGDTLLREIMVPRVDIDAIEIDTPLAEALTKVIDLGHSRIPIYEESLDRIRGILYAKDLLPALREGQSTTTLGELMRPAYFVPETIRVNALLESLQQRKVHMAIAVDEYGGVSGLATIEDLIEQIVGEIQDEYDTEEAPIREAGPGVFEVDAALSLDEVNDVTGLSLESSGADRIGGLIYERLGRVPRVGDEVELSEAVIAVMSVKGVRPQRLRITRHGDKSLAAPIALNASEDINGPT